jgi:dihydroxy-acid dehydratase
MIGLVQNGDQITIDAESNTIDVDLTDEEIIVRRNLWTTPELKVKSGVLYKYAKQVASASQGCVTDL